LEKRGVRSEFLDQFPELTPYQEEVYQDFMLLSQRRPSGFGPASIPYSEIKSYCDLKGIDDPLVLKDFVQLIEKLDITWLEWAIEQQENE